MHRLCREQRGTELKKEMTNKSLTKKQNVKTPHGSHRRSEEARPIVKINRPTGR